MTDIKLNQICAACNGTGIRRYNSSPNGPLVEENPCLECGGDGRADASFNLESTLFDEILDKVTKIKKIVNDIWDKVNV